MAPGYVPPGMAPYQPVAMTTGQPIAYAHSGIPGMPTAYAPQLTSSMQQQQPVMGTFQPIANTASPAVMSKLVLFNLELVSSCVLVII